MAKLSLADIRQLLKVVDGAPTALGRPDVLFTVDNLSALKWWLDEVDPGWRDRQVREGGVFGRAV
jgi:hypothetical protein